MNETMLFLILFILGTAVTQWTSGRAHKLLTPEQKLAAMESAPKFPWVMVAIAGISGLQFWLSSRFGHSAWLHGAFTLALLLVVAGGLLGMIFRLKRLGLPRHFIRSIALSQVVVFSLLALMLWSMHRTTYRVLAEADKVLSKKT